MGEKIKVLSKGNLKKAKIEIELNKANTRGGLRSVHLQNKDFRLEFDEVEFLKLATGVIAAKRKLLALKGDL